jgi:hypothetical protein
VSDRRVWSLGDEEEVKMAVGEEDVDGEI